MTEKLVNKKELIKALEKANQTAFERKIKDKTYMYADISAKQFKTFKKNKDLLSQNEIKTLQEIAEVKRKTKADWGV